MLILQFNFILHSMFRNRLNSLKCLNVVHVLLRKNEWHACVFHEISSWPNDHSPSKNWVTDIPFSLLIYYFPLHNNVKIISVSLLLLVYACVENTFLWTLPHQNRFEKAVTKKRHEKVTRCHDGRYGRKGVLPTYYGWKPISLISKTCFMFAKFTRGHIRITKPLFLGELIV